MARHTGASILLLQEPWVRHSQICGLGRLSNRILTGTTEGAPWTCIVIVDPALDVTVLRHLSNEHCVCAQITSSLGTYVVSAYYPPSKDMVLSLGSLRRIAKALGTTRIIVSADTNTSSPLWFSRDTDLRGRRVEDFLAETRWMTRNEPGNPPTFSTLNGQSNVDVTLPPKVRGLSSALGKSGLVGRAVITEPLTSPWVQTAPLSRSELHASTQNGLLGHIYGDLRRLVPART